MTTANTPEPQHDYAYVPVAHQLSQPLRVTVLRLRGDHSVVVIHHPDTGVKIEAIENSRLTDKWNEKPTSALWPGFVGEQTWAQIYAATYEHICDERRLAERLIALGIERKLRHYAGRGGTATEAGEADAVLNLSPDELRYLLDLAERGKKQEAATEES